MHRPVFRFAPSPNGFLHLGHAYSALLNARMASEAGGRLLLRIEDTDQTRSRPEFVQAIFEDLAWLGLDWEEPVRIQSQHFADYEANLARLWEMSAIYPCFCSRKTALGHALPTCDPDGQPHYGGFCRALRRSEAERRVTRGDTHGWRLDMERLGDGEARQWGDAMIAKRRVGSSYHIAVVTDDALQGVTLVVRGQDIEPATPLHKLLQRLLALPTPHYLHHQLIRDSAGQKLSKSLDSTSLRQLRAAGTTAEDIRRKLGFA
ncbi:tRNA glutamyl-Q(34) synthetase GluQRS [Aestuariivirga litoralis]|uniref:tRNA glutamyl-Q(34) synthetase GluQRS n=1 Tax=Aestuariivirga litoralis TaxID=2650924 RepID=A0A2W2BVB1_9HYPH|nr:tRNA glutamyl-Q(34) synthetase GluQRS [Aestuariivirga litoralis]PZF77416.1 tRNA glutamyl-Q(34) synthetase GluQRS [Aestuariivirga litoralis]